MYTPPRPNEEGTGKVILVTQLAQIIMAQNTGRVAGCFYNSGSVPIYLALGYIPSAGVQGSFTLPIPASSYYELPNSAADGVFKGDVYVICAATQTAYMQSTETM